MKRTIDRNQLWKLCQEEFKETVPTTIVKDFILLMDKTIDHLQERVAEKEESADYWLKTLERHLEQEKSSIFKRISLQIRKLLRIL